VTDVGCDGQNPKSVVYLPKASLRQKIMSKADSFSLLSSKLVISVP
jgi:hypothetical protein